MDRELLPNRENVASELLSEFKKLFGLISNLEHEDLSDTAEKIKKLIFNQLKVTGKLTNETSYEDWKEEMFPNTEHPRPTLLIEMAREYGIINSENTGEILHQKLVQLLNDYRSRNSFNLNQALMAEIEEAIAKDITSAEYNILAGKLLSQVYR